ncbi:Hypothetical predicted protein [Paramuricea clavata]|uniref:Uncharacterized protein n=1 Tax=Paramuricea clavata TaxID=317549 RepID=A0A7D9JGU5_PARCT|nr:Hypothetical predicted protein [Paramuricea clavata]
MAFRPEEDLNTSILSLHIDDEEVDDSVTLCHSGRLLTSTPKKVCRKLYDDLSYETSQCSNVQKDCGDGRRGTKHNLTPNSKSLNQPNAKRFLVGGKPSGKEVNYRLSMLESKINAAFVQQEDCEVDKAVVLSYLGLNEDESILVTRTIKSIFPMVRTRRNRVNGMYPLLWFKIILNNVMPICKSVYNLLQSHILNK